MKRVLISIAIAAAAAAAPFGCSSATTPSGGAPAPTPTPVGTTAGPAEVYGAPPAVGRVNPNVVEETDTYTIQRLPKTDYIRVDDRHIRHPVLATVVEFFREDENYYYISTPKPIPGMPTPTPRPPGPRTTPEVKPPPLSEFTDISPARVGGRIRLEKVAASGLPDGGLWRASFVVADVTEDGIADIVSPPPRIGDEPRLHIWKGDGKGHFTKWPLTFTEAGKKQADPGLDYGGVAVGDIDGDGHMDVAAASHGGGLAVFYGDGKGGFRVDRTGLPGGDFSAQAIVLLDVSRDGKLDIVASRDIVEQTGRVDTQQVRVYVNVAPRGFQFHDGLSGGFYSNSLNTMDYDGDGLQDVLTGSHYNGALTLLWRNGGDANFSRVSFDEIEGFAYHFSTAPGTFGAARVPAYADNYYSGTNEPELARAAGISLYSYEAGKWTRHRVWRKKESKTFQYALAMGDLDGDKLDDIVFPDSEQNRLRVFLQQRDGSFVEAAEAEEPAIASPGQCVRLADLDKDGKLDVVLSRTVSSIRPDEQGGWDVFLNRR